MQKQSNQRGYKTLPSAFRRSDESRRSGKVSSSQTSPNGGNGGTPLFGGLSIGNLISGGMQFFGQLGRKKNTSGSSMSPPPRSSSASDRLTTSTFMTSTKVATETASEALISIKFGASSATSACVSELIEMTSFPTTTSGLTPVYAEGDTEQVGVGHVFKPVGTFNPTWCDLCRDLVWGLYDTGASRCVNCHLTCHLKCQSKIQLNCAALAAVNFNELQEMAEPLIAEEDSSSTSSADDLDKDESTLANISTLRDEEYNITLKDAIEHSDDDDDEYKTLRDVSAIEDLTLDEDDDELTEEDLMWTSSKIDFEKAIECYNKNYPIGQETCAILRDDKDLDKGQLPLTNCRGYIRVSLNLRRPIHVAQGTRPPSIYNLTSTTLTDNNRTLTSFYLPQDTIRALHLTSLTTVYDVIRALLGKFRVVDNPHKFALYERKESVDHADGRMGRQNLRKMSDEERPLLLALSRCLEECEISSFVEECCYFVLQENDPGEICWESFTLPELKNFLLILDREEAWYKRKIHEKYEIVEDTIKQVMEEKKEDSSEI